MTPTSIQTIGLAARRKLSRRYKLHIRGPFVGGLYSCYLPSKPGLSATGLTPEMAYNAWKSYQEVLK